ncbi:MAG TPA: RNA pseudouridine synthase [Verrucomicrobiae bacterium]|nr:RNA pseudouridine synthase [Verrucomicrobiae bacterium]
MARPNCIQLGDEVSIPILFEDRSVLAIDKPPGWMLVPYSWDRTGRNLQLAISSSILGGEFWARSRSLKFLKYVHRLDAETTGILLFAKSQGALNTFSEMFETRRMEKRYLAVARGNPKKDEWLADAKLGPDPSQHGRHRVDPQGKDAETHFKVLERREGLALIEARPFTGRTHQIRIHLAHAGLPIVGDTMYGAPEDRARKIAPMGLRAAGLAYMDPFQRRRVKIEAPTQSFIAQFFGVEPEKVSS